MAVTRRKGDARGPRALGLLVIFLVLALPLQHLLDGISARAAIFASGKVLSTSALPRQTDQVGLASVTDWSGETSRIPTLFLRVDHKQNLLRWPVVAGNITRSPPSRISL
jgi:hypothetical protein